MKFLKSNLMILFVLVSFATCITSCKKDIVETKESNEVLVPKKYELQVNTSQINNVLIDKNREDLSNIISEALQNVEFRKLLKKEALKQQDGDYDVLYQNIKSKSVDKGRTVEDYLFESYINKKGVKATKKDFNKLIASVPDFQISIPVNCKKWETSTQIPLVAYVPTNFDEKTIKYIKAFDVKGNIYYLSAQEEPEVPVIVLSSCERMNYQAPDVTLLDISSDVKYAKRLSGMTEMIAKIKFNHLSWVEPWFMGGPEIKVKAVVNDGVVLLNTTLFYSRDEVNNKWGEAWVPMGRWYFSGLECLAYKFVEDDRNYEVTVPLSYTYKKGNSTFKVSFSLKYSEKDDDICEAAVYSDDPKWTQYGGGSSAIMQWQETYH